MTAGDTRQGALGEFGRIARYLAPLAAERPGALGLTDDAAMIEVPVGRRLVVTVDAIVEGVHFRAGDPPDLVARKLLRVNLSDLAAKTAHPFGYLLTMALPVACDDAWVERFAQGLAVDQRRYGMGLLGGDSVSTPGPVALTATAIGLLGCDWSVHRKGARAGDLVFVSGSIGDGALGLLAAAGHLSRLSRPDQEFLIERYLLPVPRVELGLALAPLPHAMMDVSDGLVADVGHIAEQSGVAVMIDAARVPFSAPTRRAVDGDPALLATILTGGDDYELVFMVAAADREAVMSAARKAGTVITEIGRVTSGSGVYVLGDDGQELQFARPGWRHA